MKMLQTLIFMQTILVGVNTIVLLMIGYGTLKVITNEKLNQK